MSRALCDMRVRFDVDEERSRAHLDCMSAAAAGSILGIEHTRGLFYETHWYCLVLVIHYLKQRDETAQVINDGDRKQTGVKWPSKVGTPSRRVWQATIWSVKFLCRDVQPYRSYRHGDNSNLLVCMIQ